MSVEVLAALVRRVLLMITGDMERWRKSLQKFQTLQHIICLMSVIELNIKWITVYFYIFTVLVASVIESSADDYWAYGDMEEVPDDIPDATTVVRITRKSITRIPSNIFSHLSICIWMDLKYNDISILETNAFAGRGKLHEWKT